METAIINSEDLYFEHKQWMREIAFWEQELAFFRKHLEPLVKTTSDKAALAGIDHFENQFKIHSSRIQEFKDAIENHQQNLAAHAKAHVNSIDRLHYKKHVGLRDKIGCERELYQDLKKEYYKFLAQFIARDVPL
jgi:hypothetical protein